MNLHCIILDPFSHRKTVLIYDANADMFFTAPRYGEFDHSKTDIIIFFSVMFLICVVAPLCDMIFLKNVVADAETRCIYIGLILVTAFISSKACKKDLERLNDSLQFYHYQKLSLSLAQELITPAQRKKYFSKLQSMWKLPRFIICLLIMMSLWIWSVTALSQNYSTTMLCGILLLLHVVISSFYSTINAFSNPNMKYLLTKFC